MTTQILILAMTLFTSTPEQPISETEQATTAPKPITKLAQITGDNVYVRSGASTNFYPVARLNRGQRVMVSEINHGWAHIAPPRNCFSLVAKEFVDPDGPDKGLINSDRVWVHPWSELDPGPYYAKQMQLRRGQAVQIQSEVDSFYKIAPPQGAKLWISADYIEIIEVDLTEQTRVEGTEGQAQAMPPPPSDENIADQVEKEVINLIEVDLQAEFDKDIMQRDLKLFVDKFEKLTTEDNGFATRQYATYRIAQLNKAIAHIEALKEIRVLATQVEQERKQYMKERAGIRPADPQIEPSYAVRGKLVKSFAYDNPVGPRRYRLVDPDSETGRTIAYVEIETDSDIDPEAYLGRFVGIRAQGKRLITGAVDAVVVYLAAEIVILEQPVESDSDITETTTTPE